MDKGKNQFEQHGLPGGRWDRGRWLLTTLPARQSSSLLFHISMAQSTRLSPSMSADAIIGASRFLNRDSSSTLIFYSFGSCIPLPPERQIVDEPSMGHLLLRWGTAIILLSVGLYRAPWPRTVTGNASRDVDLVAVM